MNANYIEYGSKTYKYALFALFLAGFATFALLYSVQPILPDIAQAFAVSSATSSLALSSTTLSLALSLLIAGALSERFGRKPVMVWALLIASALGIACALVDDWFSFLLLRTLLGVALSGLPALAMAYISEEFSAKALAQAMGLYISGTALGGLIGRLLAGFLSDIGTWHWALMGMAILSLVSGVCFMLLLPRSKHFTAQPLAFRSLMHNFAEHLRHPQLRYLFFIAFLLMGSFVTLFNYIGFYLSAAPYQLSNSLIGAIFLVYIFGVFSASLSGRFVQRYSAKRMLQVYILIFSLGIVLCLLPWLPAIILGLTLAAIGFFAAHAIASGLVGYYANHARGQASSLYLCAYYLGSSVLGYVLGWLWYFDGWGALLAALLVCLFSIIFCARKL